MQTKKALIVGGVLAVGILVLAGGVYAFQESKQEIRSLTQLNKACHETKDQDGFGNVTLSGGNFHDETGKLTNPCKIHILPGTTLQLKSIQLESADLLIDDQGGKTKTDEKHKPSHVILSGVNFSGQNAGFLINLSLTGSSIVIQDSMLNYPHSVGAGSGEGDADATATISILRSEIRSKSESSEGITMVSTGHAIFMDNKFELYEPDDIALLLGGTCEFRNNTNASNSCPEGQ